MTRFCTSILMLVLAFVAPSLKAQTIESFTSGSKASFRGLSAVNDRVIWVSGSAGTIGLSVDSGHTWKMVTVKGFEKTEFRDIEAFDETSAVIMAISEPARILRTSDGGETWKVVYENAQKGMFLDAMEFWNLQSGIVVGDPINGKVFIARTFDGGFHWQEIPENLRPVADSGEAMFASSGTNVRKINNEEAIIVTGGKSSNLLIRDRKINIPIVQGQESTGTNSIAIKNKNTYITVGGDFLKKDSTFQNCAITKDGGASWQTPTIPPHGYRSCVEYLQGNKWITCGLNGVDLTTDDGQNWQPISTIGFHVCRKSTKGNYVFFAGGGGRIARLKFK